MRYEAVLAQIMQQGYCPLPSALALLLSHPSSEDIIRRVKSTWDENTQNASHALLAQLP